MHFDNAIMCLENLKFISNLAFASGLIPTLGAPV